MTGKQSNKHHFIKRLESHRDSENRAVLAALRRGNKPEMLRYVIDFQTERNKGLYLHNCFALRVASKICQTWQYGRSLAGAGCQRW